MRIESSDLELISIYHSHPQGPEEPSASDIVQSYYPECVYLIWARKSLIWNCNAFLIQDEQVVGVPIFV